MSTTSSQIEGTYTQGIQTNRLTIAGVGSTGVAIGTDGVTGIVTYFSGEFISLIPTLEKMIFLVLEQRKLKVLNVDALYPLELEF